MGCDSLLDSNVGYCSQCKTQYVVSAKIGCHDSHILVSETYACPSCQTNNPLQVQNAKNDLKKFARKQLERRLFWQDPNGLEILTSNTS